MRPKSPWFGLRRLAAATLALLVGGGMGSAMQAQAQGSTKVYRCGTGQYSQTPCPDGQPLAVDPAPDAAQQREAEAVAARERRLAEQLRAERHAREQLAAGQQPVRIGPAASAASAPTPRHGKLAKTKRRSAAASAATADQPEAKSRRAYAPKPKPEQKR